MIDLVNINDIPNSMHLLCISVPVHGIACTFYTCTCTQHCMHLLYIHVPAHSTVFTFYTYMYLYTTLHAPSIHTCTCIQHSMHLLYIHVPVHSIACTFYTYMYLYQGFRVLAAWWLKPPCLKQVLASFSNKNWLKLSNISILCIDMPQNVYNSY